MANEHEVPHEFLVSIFKALGAARAFHVARDAMNAATHTSPVRPSSITRQIVEEHDRLADVLGLDTDEWESVEGGDTVGSPV